MEFLRSLLVLGIKMIDEGRCNHLSPEEIASLTDTVSSVVVRPEALTLVGACNYLKISRTKFMTLRSKKVIPEPVKRIGFKEKVYFPKDLDKAKPYI